MNLVAKEYLASRARPGVLILSEMAGAAAELGEALVVNPNNAEEVADALHRALHMPEEEQVIRSQAMQERVRRHDVHWWAQSFLDSLRKAHAGLSASVPQPLSLPNRQGLVAAFTSAKSRLLLLDYDGTLAPFATHPDQAEPSATLLALLERVCELPCTRVAIVSGRSRHSLHDWFGHLAMDLFAEHGAWRRDQDGTWILSPLATAAWKEVVRPYLRSSAEEVPGAFVEEKDFSLAWHFRAADPELGRHRAQALMDTLVTLVAHLGVQVVPGHRVVETRCAVLHKGLVAERLVAETQPTFVLAVGNGRTDEDLFRAVPPHGWTIKVGGQPPSCARFSLPGPEEVLGLLEALTAAGVPSWAALAQGRRCRVGRLR
jgi:trehalose 6-phosphate synthase/phosphatase